MYLLQKFFLWSSCLSGLWWNNCGRVGRSHTFLTLCSKFRHSLLEEYMKCWMKSEDQNIFIFPRMIPLCQIKSMKEPDKETLPPYLHKYFWEFRTMSLKGKHFANFQSFELLCKHWPSQSTVGSILVSARIWQWDCSTVWWFNTFVWLMPSDWLFLHMFLIRYHLIIAEQESCELLDINLGKATIWFGLYEQMHFLFNLCIGMKHRGYLQHMLRCDT